MLKSAGVQTRVQLWVTLLAEPDDRHFGLGGRHGESGAVGGNKDGFVHRSKCNRRRNRRGRSRVGARLREDYR